MGVILENGYEMKTTFWQDFTIADAFGKKAIEDTYRMSFNGWKNNYVYMTELTLVLNWKLWQHYNKHDKLWMIYNDLYLKCDRWCMNNLKGAEMDYFLTWTN